MDKKLTFILLPLFLGVFLNTNFCQGSSKFDWRKTGVVFSAYNNTPPENAKGYSLNEVKEMMKTISTQFSRVTTHGFGVKEGVVSYSSEGNRSAHFFAAEAAAWANNETAKDSPKLELYVGVWVHSNTTLFTHEMEIAKNATQKANEISEGTVKGVVFSNPMISTDEKVAALTSSAITNATTESKGTIKYGSRQNCDTINATDDSPLTLKRIDIIKASDFIICIIDSKSLASFKVTFTKLNATLTGIKPDVEVMGETGILAMADNPTQVLNMQTFWNDTSNWANKEASISAMWMSQAIDTEMATGWWTDALTEKVNILKTPEDPPKINHEPSLPGNNNHSSKPVSTPTSGTESTKIISYNNAVVILGVALFRLVV